VKAYANPKTRGETLVRTNLGEKTSLVLFFLCSDFILTFDFVSSFGRTDAQYTLFWVLYS
jgi:hypothetical protein